MSSDYATFGLGRKLSRRKWTARRPASRPPLRLESLEPRHLLSGVGGPTLDAIPTATANHYAADEDVIDLR